MINVVAGVGLACSLSAIVYMIARKRYRKSFEVSYLNLAAADCILCLLVITMLGSEREDYAIRSKTYSRQCDLLAIVPIACDRLYASFRPLSYDRSLKFVLFVCSFCWTIPAILNPICFDIIQDVYDAYFIYRKTEIVFYCITPMMFNLIAFIVVLRRLRTTSRKSHQAFYLNTVRAIIVTIIFAVSWIPGEVAILMEDRDRFYKVYFFYQINAISDPFLYLIPNQLLRKIFAKFKLQGIWSTASNGSGNKAKSGAVEALQNSRTGNTYLNKDTNFTSP